MNDHGEQEVRRTQLRPMQRLHTIPTGITIGIIGRITRRVIAAMVIGIQTRIGITAWTMHRKMGTGAAMTAGTNKTIAGTTFGRIPTMAHGTMIGGRTMMITRRGMIETMTGTTIETMNGTTTETTTGKTIRTTVTGILIPETMIAMVKTATTDAMERTDETDGITNTTMSGTTRTHGEADLRAR